MRPAHTLSLDPQTGDLTLDDGHPAPPPSEAVGLVVWTLRTVYGTCPAARDLGVRWSVAQTDVVGAPKALEKELTRAMQWIADLGFLTELAVTVTRTGRGRLQYEIAFDPPDGARTTIRGTV
jgi:hypothetical protein